MVSLSLLEEPAANAFLGYFQTLNVVLKQTVLLGEHIVFIILFHDLTLALMDESLYEICLTLEVPIGICNNACDGDGCDR